MNKFRKVAMNNDKEIAMIREEQEKQKLAATAESQETQNANE
jgi:hypothetical protein